MTHRLESHRTSVFSPWTDFDTHAYLHKNYRHRILQEDEDVLRLVCAKLPKIFSEFGPVYRAADVGTGPNLYPGLLLSSLLEKDGTIELLDPLAQNVQYLETLRASTDAARADWGKWEKAIQGFGLDADLGWLLKSCRIKQTSLELLQPNAYDAVSCFFVTCSISNIKDEFVKRTHSLMSCLRPGGVLIAAHILGSNAYDAGNGTNFPSTYLTLDEVESAYLPLGEFGVFPIEHTAATAFRQGYTGIAVVIGKRSLADSGEDGQL